MDWRWLDFCRKILCIVDMHVLDRLCAVCIKYRRHSFPRHDISSYLVLKQNSHSHTHTHLKKKSRSIHVCLKATAEQFKTSQISNNNIIINVNVWCDFIIHLSLPLPPSLHDNTLTLRKMHSRSIRNGRKELLSGRKKRKTDLLEEYMC